MSEAVGQGKVHVSDAVLNYKAPDTDLKLEGQFLQDVEVEKVAPMSFWRQPEVVFHVVRHFVNFLVDGR